MGQLLAIWCKRGKRAPMDPRNEVELVEGHGLRDDANNSPTRQVTVIDEESWREVERELGRTLDPRLRRANLMTRGVDLEDTRGRVLTIGAARIEVVGETVPCDRMEEASPGLKEALRPRWRGGVYGRVVGSGVIRIGDSVGWEGP